MSTLRVGLKIPCSTALIWKLWYDDNELYLKDVEMLRVLNVGCKNIRSLLDYHKFKGFIYNKICSVVVQVKKDLQLQLLLLLFVRYFHLIGQFTKIHAINFRWLSVSEHLNVRFSSYNFHVPKYINKMERFYFYLKGITLLKIRNSRAW